MDPVADAMVELPDDTVLENPETVVLAVPVGQVALEAPVGLVVQLSICLEVPDCLDHLVVLVCLVDQEVRHYLEVQDSR